GTESPPLTVSFYDVGQGDAIHIRTQEGFDVLIDGGPNSSNSTLNPIIRFLEGKGVKNIDMVFMSHPHSDHYYGLIPVFSRYTVGKYYDSFITGSGTAESFRTLAKSKAAVYEDTRTRNLSTSATFYSLTSTTPPLYMVMHHQGDAFGNPPPSANDASLVFAVKFGSSSFIFGGDAGGSGSYKPLEGALIGIGIPPPKPSAINKLPSTIDCYKVNHHGSDSSSTDAFLNYIRPKYAFIGVGLGNSFGHPRQTTLDRLKNILTQTNPGAIGGYYGSGIFATDYDGTIEVVTTGDGNYTINGKFSPTAGGGSGGGVVGGDTTSSGEPLHFVNALNNLFYPDRGEWLRIEYYLNRPGETLFRVYSLSGEVVLEEKKSDDYAGDLRAWVWSGKNSEGATVAPGAYFVFIKTPDGQSVKKAVVMR
ncbi:MAG: MBL fold metallo-hydrolase, partial [Endomicrobiia bacterium]|nr:MBL fold metallo-hydrolase [Endomicrobiia bacterium]